VEHTIERDYERVRRKDLELHTLIEKLGNSLSRIETRLEGLERHQRNKPHES
jgi:hypothetical protein